MNVNPQAIAAMRAITISREYGSGGGEIAARLVQRLGWQLIDHAVIEQTAREQTGGAAPCALAMGQAAVPCGA